MEWPKETGVMVLPNVILFPQAFLPLYIFEPRYRRMLADALDSHRMFCVALRRPAAQREAPVGIAGLGLIRAAREHADGTSHVILQGLARVELGPATRYRPYRIHPLHLLESKLEDSVAADALTSRLLELVADQLAKGTLPPGMKAAPHLGGGAAGTASPPPPLKQGVEILAQMQNPEQIADLVSWALLADPTQRQLLLETLDVETRLRRLIQFLTIQPPSSSQKA